MYTTTRSGASWKTYLGIASGLVLLTSTAQAGYTVTDVTNPGDPVFTQLLGINNSGVLAGYFGDGTVVPNNGFTMTLPSNFTAENFPGSAQTQVVAINSAGDTAGFYVDIAGNTHGFVDVGGTFTTVDNPSSATFNQLLGLNSNNEAAGYYQLGSGATLTQTAYTWQGGVFTSLASFLPAGTTISQATSVNNAGVVAGFYGSSGFILNGATLTTLMYPGSQSTQALGVNNLGQVVGDYVDAGNVMHGFIWDGTNFTSFDPTGSIGTTINGINDKGQIVGFFLDANENTIGFVGDPTAVPEPASLVLLGGGLVALGLRARMRRGDSAAA